MLDRAGSPAVPVPPELTTMRLLVVDDEEARVWWARIASA